MVATHAAPTPASSAVAARQEADDDVEEGDHAADDGHDDPTDAVDDGHDAVSDGSEKAGNLLEEPWLVGGRVGLRADSVTRMGV